MKNPFIYGEEVSGEYFCDRKEEIKELLRDIMNSQNVIIFSPRRYGKTSLIKEVLRRTSGILTFCVDLYPAINKQKFIEQYATGISKGLLGKKETILKTIKDLLPRIIPKVVVKTEGEIDWEFDFDRTKKISPVLDDLLVAVKNRADKTGQKAVLVFDEFQEIVNYEDDEIERKMRSVFQTHHNVSYIFMGSKRHLMNDLFNNPNRPFYKSGKHFPLGKIKREDFVPFIEEKFRTWKYQLKRETINYILNLTECHPYYTQMLCHIMWEETESKNITPEGIDLCFKKLITRESSSYFNIWEGLSQGQKQLLVAMAHEETTEPFRADFIRRYNLSSPSSVQKAIKTLIEKEIIERTNSTYTISDLFFKHWLKREF